MSELAALSDAGEPGTRRVVLVEGISDAAAIETLAGRLGAPLRERGTRVVPMGGATNVRRYAHHFGPAGLGLPLTGLCDAAERRFFEAVLPAGAVPNAPTNSGNRTSPTPNSPTAPR